MRPCIRRDGIALAKRSSATGRSLADLANVRQQRHETGSLDRGLGPALTLGAIAAALAREDLASLRQQLLQAIEILVVDVIDLLAAETTLHLLTHVIEFTTTTTLLFSHNVSFTI